MLRARTSTAGLAFLAALTFTVAGSADEAKAPAPDTTLVTMTGDTARLQVAFGEWWVDACTTPCDQWLPRGAIFRIRGGSKEPDSKPFTLASRGSRAQLKVHTGSVAAQVGGVVLTVLGGASFVGGVFMLLVGSARPQGGGGSNGFNSFIVGGAVAVVGGLLGLTLGTVLTLSRTTVDQSESTSSIRTAEWISPRFTPAPTSLGWTFTF